MSAAWIPAIVAGLGYLTSKKTASGAGAQAEQLSAEQRALLQQILQWGQKYGEPALAKAYDWATNPYENAFERGLTERTRQGIETAYRPAYGQMMQGLSSRGMMNPYNSVMPQYTAALERNRAGQVSGMYQQQQANKQNEMGNRLQAFSNMLSQMRGGNVSGAGAYQSPINTYAGLASQAGASGGNAIAQLLQWLMLQQQKKGTGTGTPVTSPHVNLGGLDPYNLSMPQ